MENKIKNEYDLSLPTEKSKPETDLSKYTILLYGQEKIGKTSFCAQFPKPIVLFFEPGGKDLSIYKKEIQDWEHLRGLVKKIKNDTTFQNVIFDTTDVAYNMCEKWTCAAQGIQDPGDGDYGSGWRAIRKEFTRVVLELTKCGKGVIFTSHATEKTVKTRFGDFDRTVPTMSKQAREIIEPLVDIWVYYQYTDQKGNREFVIRGNQEISAGTRTKNHFLGINRIPAGASEEEAYKNFMDAFNNKLQPTKPTFFKLKK